MPKKKIRVSEIPLLLWNSPTFTSWGNYLVQSLRLIAVTPLILTRFDTTEIAAWYLFASLNFFGTVLLQRIGVTFSRMFAFARGGATDLSPIENAKAPAETNGEIPWPLISRLYGTLGTLQTATSLLSVLVASIIGFFALGNLVGSFDPENPVWIAFFLMQSSSLLGFIFNRYLVTLRGFNKIALSNRWNVLFTLLSVLAGFTTLTLGGNIVALVVAMQTLTVLGLLRNRLLLSHVLGDKFHTFPSGGLDRQILGWSWPPLWKGFVAQFSATATIQLSGVILTSVASPAVVASYLFSLRMIQVITQFSQAPFSSQQPRFSKLMAEGNYAKLRPSVETRILYSQALMLLGAVAFGILAPYGLEFIGSNIILLPSHLWFALATILLHNQFNFLSSSVCYAGNNIVLFWRFAISGFASLALLFALAPTLGITGILIAIAAPMLLVMNWQPAKKASAQILETNTLAFFKKSYLPALSAALLLWIVFILVTSIT